MRASSFEIIVIGGVVSLTPVFAAEAQQTAAVPATVVSATDADANKTICAATGRYYYGSRIPQKVCHTQREWEVIRKYEKGAVEEARRIFTSLP